MLNNKDIRRADIYNIDGQQFSNEFSAQRYVAEQNLIETLGRLGMPHVRSFDGLGPNEKLRPARKEDFSLTTEDFRRWLTEHVHTLLPIIQAVADANPLQESYPLEEEDPNPYARKRDLQT